jgi:hypothetical protein
MALSQLRARLPAFMSMSAVAGFAHPQNQELAIETVGMDIAELLDAISTGHCTTPYFNIRALWCMAVPAVSVCSNASSRAGAQVGHQLQLTADANAAARTDPISVGRRLLRGGRNV